MKPETWKACDKGIYGLWSSLTGLVVTLTPSVSTLAWPPLKPEMEKWKVRYTALFELHISSHSGKQFSYLDCWVAAHHVQTVYKQMEIICNILRGKVFRSAWYSVVSWALWVEMHKWYQSFLEKYVPATAKISNWSKKWSEIWPGMKKVG